MKRFLAHGFALVVATLVSFSGLAHATPTFPGDIQSHLALSYTPQCALCHTDGNAGGKGTVNTPFGKSIRAQGLVAYDTAGLDSDLDAMAAAGTDSDGDGVPDITELKNGTDPNTADVKATDGGTGAGGEGGAATTGTGNGATSSATSQPEPPQYGCGAPRVSSPHDNELPWIILGLVSLGIGIRRRRS